MRLIDIDAFRKDWGLAERCEDCERDARECQYAQIYTHMDFCGWLDDAEIIDAVPVVRCKDCRYLKTGENESESWSICARKIVYPYVDVEPNDYCSYGERRSE